MIVQYLEKFITWYANLYKDIKIDNKNLSKYYY